MGVLKDCIDRDDFESKRWELVPSYLNLVHFCNDHDEKETDLPDIWKRNIEENIAWLDENKDRVVGSVHDIAPHENQAIILVGASPVIKKQWKNLEEVDDRFVVVAVNSSAKYLINRGITPDYVVCVNGQTSPEWTLDVGKKGKDIIGIFSVSVAPEALRQWPGKIMILPYKYNGIPNLMKKMKRRWGEHVPAGGNAFNAAFVVFLLKTKVKIYLLAGNELSWSKTYYAQGSSANDEVPYYFATDAYGKEVKTLLPLYNYKVWLEHVMSMAWPECVFFNCSGGILGVDVDGKHLPFIYQNPLGEAIELTKGAFAFEKKDWKEKQKLIYEDAYFNRDYYPTNSKNIWGLLVKQMYPFDKGLDIGCGPGVGLKMAIEAGCNVWGVDIVDLDKNWKENGIRDRCIQAPANDMPFKDGEFDFILCSETLEHVPKDAIDETLKEITRVGSDRFIFTIGLSPDNAYWQKGVGYHSTLEEPEWWIEKLNKAGIEIAIWGISDLPSSLIIYAVKDKDPYLSGKAKLFIPGLDDDREYLFSQHKFKFQTHTEEECAVCQR